MSIARCAQQQGVAEAPPPISAPKIYSKSSTSTKQQRSGRANQPAFAEAINAQIGREFGAGLQYVAIAAHFERRQLKLLGKLFFEQAQEENQHAMKFVRYMLDTKADLQIPAVEAPTASFASAADAVQAALTWEQEVTGQIGQLMHAAARDNDYLSQGFLQWFIDEQLEEIVTDRLLTIIREAGEKHLLTVEAYLVHQA